MLNNTVTSLLITTKIYGTVNYINNYLLKRSTVEHVNTDRGWIVKVNGVAKFYIASPKAQEEVA